MSVWECLRSRREQKWVGGHRCRGSALSRLSPRSPRRARAGHIVPKQRRAAAHRARRAARCGRRDPGPSRSTGFCEKWENARAREESNMGWWSSAPWFSAFSAVATVTKAREGGTHSTQAAPSSSVSAQPAFGGGTPRPFALFGWVVWHRGPLVPKFERLSAPLPRHLF